MQKNKKYGMCLSFNLLQENITLLLVLLYLISCSEHTDNNIDKPIDAMRLIYEEPVIHPAFTLFNLLPR